MSVLPTDICIYGCQHMPEADGAVIGGAVDFTKAIDFADLTVNGTLDVVSSSNSDTATKISYQVLDQFGVTQTQTLTLAGQTAVTGSQTASRLLAGVISGGSIGSLSSPTGTAAVGDVALISHTPVITGHIAQNGANANGTTPALIQLAAGDGAAVAVGDIIRITSGTGQFQIARIIDNTSYGTDMVAVNKNWSVVPNNTSVYNIHTGMLFEIGPNAVLARTRLFSTAYSTAPGGGQTVFYEKVFIANNNTATALAAQGTNAGVALQILSDSPALPSGSLLDIGLATSYNDSQTISTRQTAPSSISFTAQPNWVYAPTPGNLAPGNAPNAAGALGIWLRLTLPGGAVPYKGSALFQFQGSTP